jgi:hypothetical protein
MLKIKENYIILKEYMINSIPQKCNIIFPENYRVNHIHFPAFYSSKMLSKLKKI